MRVDQLFRAVGTAALLALVPVGVRIAALGAGPLDIAVRKEGPGLDIVVLLAFPGDEFPFIVEFPEELGGVFVVHRGGRTGIDVEIDPEAGEGILHDLVVLVHDILRGNALLAGLDRDRNAVLVRAADENDSRSPEPQIADINVAGDICAGQVADMDRPVRIRKGAGHEGSLEFLLHICLSIFSLPRRMLIFRFLALTDSISFNMSAWSSGDAVDSSRIRVVRRDCIILSW